MIAHLAIFDKGGQKEKGETGGTRGTIDEKLNAYHVLVGKSDEKKKFGRPG
jgi:hypothetical protein